MRDPSAILIAVILPLILLFLMGYAVSLDAKNISLGIINKSNTQEAHDLVSSFVGSSSFKTHIGYDKKELMQLLQENQLKGVLEVPTTFGKHDAYTLQILIDATEPNTGGLIQNYASKIIRNWAIEEGIMPSAGISVIPRYWFNPPLSSRYFLLPGSISVVMTLIGILLTALVIAREWERGTMEALMATPTSMMEIILGKLIPYFILGLGSMILCFVVVYFWYDIPFKGSFGILFLLSAVYLFPSLSIGLLISTLAKNQFVAAQVSLIAGFLPAFLLSGFLFEITNMPIALQIFTYIIPARYFVESLQTIFLVGNIPSIFIKDMACMFLVGLFFFTLVVKKTKKGLE
ncbi:MULTISPECIES: ABC transporter permease [unclassified Sulfurospirillum]